MGYSDTPKIIFTKGGGQWLEKQSKIGADALGLDWQTNLGKARKLVRDKLTLQGNMDPSILLASPKVIEKSAKKIIDDYGYGERHIFNLGHGITQFTPPEHVQCLLETVRSYSSGFHK